MKRILSGVQATGQLHIGNYLGAIKPWAALQHDGEAFYFIPDLHTLNVRPNSAELRDATLSTVAWILAAGIDPNKSTIFVQSQVSAHSELAIILENYVTMGELSRMTQYKDKSARRGAEGQVAGLFTYPTLMASDILLYDATDVPVGEDQQQHVELARDIAERFNNLYGETFVVPVARVGKVGARVMNLQHPESKMSKSDADQTGNVMLLDSPEDVLAKFKRAVTDSGSIVEAGNDKPAITNLLQIYAGFSGQPVEKIASNYAGKGYGDFKQDLAQLVAGQLAELQDKYRQYRTNEADLIGVMREGSQKASLIAQSKVGDIKAKLGLVS